MGEGLGGKHQWFDTAVFPKGYGFQGNQRPRNQGGRNGFELPTEKDFGL